MTVPLAGFSGCNPDGRKVCQFASHRLDIHSHQFMCFLMQPQQNTTKHQDCLVCKRGSSSCSDQVAPPDHLIRSSWEERVENRRRDLKTPNIKHQDKRQMFQWKPKIYHVTFWSGNRKMRAFLLVYSKTSFSWNVVKKYNLIKWGAKGKLVLYFYWIESVLSFIDQH